MTQALRSGASVHAPRVNCNRGRTDVSVPEPQTNLEAGLPSPMLRAHFSNGYLCFTSDPGILRGCRDFPVRKSRRSHSHTHYRSVINVMGMLQQQSDYSLPKMPNRSSATPSIVGAQVLWRGSHDRAIRPCRWLLKNFVEVDNSLGADLSVVTR